jgi:thiosulfate dehydrogenase (quinone) large subunit
VFGKVSQISFSKILDIGNSRALLCSAVVQAACGTGSKALREANQNNSDMRAPVLNAELVGLNRRNSMKALNGLFTPAPRVPILYARMALGTAFLTAVTDRFGLWGAFGRPNVAWGDMPHFLEYVALLNPWFPESVIPLVGWLVTVMETCLGIALLVGIRTRLMSFLSGWLLLAFAIGMTAGTGLKSALNASVFAASACAFLLALAVKPPDEPRQPH